jgi:hypothetical protein
MAISSSIRQRAARPALEYQHVAVRFDISRLDIEDVLVGRRRGYLAFSALGLAGLILAAVDSDWLYVIIGIVGTLLLVGMSLREAIILSELRRCPALAAEHSA